MPDSLQHLIDEEQMDQLAELNFKELPINPDRFCEGISKIGYRPAAAIMDIVDNSIAANARTIIIELVTRAGTTNSTAGNVECCRIYDDGNGMSPDRIDIALEIGSEVDYPENSLSKFGFGLKSAGFSLGRRIEVSSKPDGGSPTSKFLDRDIIREVRKYGVCPQEVPQYASDWLGSVQHGTVIQVTKTASTQDSAATIKRDLLNKIGVTYYQFLSAENPISITIKVAGVEEHVEGIDLLFWDEAAPSFDADNYDAKTPCRVFEGPVGTELFSSTEDVILRISIFPMKKMNGYPGFSAEDRKRINSYRISKENCGFFFYRNGRLIRWGDQHLANLQRDDLGFRASINFTTAHDDLLNVDVSKQNLELSEDFEQKLVHLCRTPLAQAREAFEICRTMLRMGTGTEGEEFNARTEVFEESDPMEDVSPASPEERDERRGLLEEQSKARESVEDPGATEIDLATALPVVPFQRIRYSEKIIGLDIAVPGSDQHEGTYVRINKNHPYYPLIIDFFEASSPARLAIESLLWAGAVAETKSFENITDLSAEQLNLVFGHFRRVFSQTLNAWASKNQDAFE